MAGDFMAEVAAQKNAEIARLTEALAAKTRECEALRGKLTELTTRLPKAER